MDAQAGQKSPRWWLFAPALLIVLSGGLVLSPQLQASYAARGVHGLLTFLVLGRMFLRERRSGLLKCSPAELYARALRGERLGSSLEAGAVVAVVLVCAKGLASW